MRKSLKGVQEKVGKSEDNRKLEADEREMKSRGAKKGGGRPAGAT